MHQSLLSLDLFARLQQDRIRHDLLTRRADLPAHLPPAAKAIPVDGPLLYGPTHRVSQSEIADLQQLRQRGVSVKVLALHFGISQGLVSELARNVDRNSPGKRRYFSSHSGRFRQAS